MHTDSPKWADVDDRAKNEIGKRRPRKPLIERAAIVGDRLCEEFPDATCALHYNTPFQLLVATILSAQCTDVRVNMVTPALFKKYKKPADFASSPEGELEQDIRSTGFFNNKAKAIREASRQVDANFGGKLPSAMEDLLTLRGTARKTANVVRANCFDMPALTVDTHFTRITNLLGLTKEKNAEKIEFDVGSLLPPDRWSHFSHAIILHGRKTCIARRPKCDECALSDICPSAHA